MNSEWQCQLCDAWVEGATLCVCTYDPRRGMQPSDAWPMPPDDDDGDEVPSREPAPVGDAA